jgi:hypothetical protein
VADAVGSTAWQRYQRLAPARDAAFLRQHVPRLRGLAVAELDARLEEIADALDPADRDAYFVLAMGARIGTGAAELGYGAAAEAICFGLVDEMDVAAQLSPFPDGSGLALMSNALLTLTSTYTRLLAHMVEPLLGWTTFWRPTRLLRVARITPGAQRPIAGVLRYYLVHQRLFGLAAQLGVELSAMAGELAAHLARRALLFVYAHEAAHHLLGHRRSAHGFNTSARLPLCDEEQELELAADRLGLALTAQAQRTRPQLFDATVDAGFGALCAIWAVDAYQRGVFLRTGGTHPPAPVRTAEVLRTLPGRYGNAIRGYARNVHAGTDAAVDFGTLLDPAVTDSVLTDPLVHRRPGQDGYIRDLLSYQDVLRHDPEHLGAVLRRPVTGGPDLGPWLDLATAGDAGAALRHWGVPDAQTARFLDPRAALTFHTVHAALRDRLPGGMPPPDRLERAAAATTLIAPALVAPAVRGQ